MIVKKCRLNGVDRLPKGNLRAISTEDCNNNFTFKKHFNS